jgi:hypothetical protein
MGCRWPVTEEMTDGMQMAGNLKAQVASDEQEKVGVVRDWRAPKNSTAGATITGMIGDEYLVSFSFAREFACTEEMREAGSSYFIR